MSPSQKNRADYFLRAARTIAKECLQSQADGAHDRVVRKTHDLKGLAEAWGSLSGVTPAQLDVLTAERIPSFYGANDLIPDEYYTAEDSDRCLGILKMLGLLD